MSRAPRESRVSVSTKGRRAYRRRPTMCASSVRLVSTGIPLLRGFPSVARATPLRGKRLLAGIDLEYERATWPADSAEDFS